MTDGDDLRSRLRADLTSAVRSRDRVTVTALRAALTAIDNAEAVPMDSARPAAHPAAPFGSAEVPRLELTEAQVRDVLAAELAELVDAARHYEQLGRGERVDALRAQAAVLEQYARP